MPSAPHEDRELGERIRRFRIEKGLSQAELSRAASISAPYLSELESGLARRPSGQILLALAGALGVTIADLLGTPVATPARELPQSLLQFAEQRGLAQADVEMLASIRFRGEPPRSVRRWEMIYDTIRTSRGLDDEPD